MVAEDRGPQIAGVAIGFLICTWIFVSLRCYVRVFMTMTFGVDDWLAVISLALFTVYCTFVLKGVEYGTGQHLDNVLESKIPIALKWWFFCEIAYVSCCTVFKASICVFLARVCAKRSHLYIIYGVLAAVVTFSICYFFIIVFQCSPVAYFWTQYTGGTGKCVNVKVIEISSYIHSALSAIVDWTMGILPIFLVRDLQMTIRTKLLVVMILALGAVGSTATIVRIPYLRQLADKDFLYVTTDVAIWSTVEPGIGITAAAMACLRPLFRTFLSRSKLFNSSKLDNSSGFPSSSRQASKAGYIRSGPRKTSHSGTEELCLRHDIGKGNGIITTIKSVTGSPYGTGDEVGQGKKIRTFSVVKALKWDQAATYDSDEEILAGQTRMTNTVNWSGVRKTTTVTSSQEVMPAKSGVLAKGGQESYTRFG